MELRYIWDTNIVIYYLQNEFPLVGELFIDKLLDRFQPTLSVITEIELLSWQTAVDDNIISVRSFISKSFIYELNNDIKLKTVEIRKEFKIKIPDAVIAATAIVNNQILISRNLSDFGKIPKLRIVNPFNMAEDKL